jgi:hypothetical protein
VISKKYLGNPENMLKCLMSVDREKLADNINALPLDKRRRAMLGLSGQGKPKLTLLARTLALQADLQRGGGDLDSALEGYEQLRRDVQKEFNIVLPEITPSG